MVVVVGISPFAIEDPHHKMVKAWFAMVKVLEQQPTSLSEGRSMEQVRKLLGYPRRLGFSSIERCKTKYLETTMEYEGGSGGGGFTVENRNQLMICPFWQLPDWLARWAKVGRP